MARLALALALALSGAALAQEPPFSISITKPADGARVKIEELGPRNTYFVSGTLTGGREPYSVTVNGRRAGVSPGQRWSVDLPLRSGRNTLTARATDGGGATATSAITVTVVSGSGGGSDPRRWPAQPRTRKPCPAPRVGFGRVVELRVARITCARAARVVRATQRDRGRACTPNRADGLFSRCSGAGFRCYSRFRGGTRIQFACVRGRLAARWYQVS